MTRPGSGSAQQRNRPRLSRVAAAAPEVATALGYDVAAALEEPDDH
jgi:hypothetical protein